MNLEDHPTVRRLDERVQRGLGQQPPEPILDGGWLRRLALDCGADDAGLVEIGRAGLAPQREEILRNYPWTKSLLSHRERNRKCGPDRRGRGHHANDECGALSYRNRLAGKGLPHSGLPGTTRLHIPGRNRRTTVSKRLSRRHCHHE